MFEVSHLSLPFVALLSDHEERVARGAINFKGRSTRYSWIPPSIFSPCEEHIPVSVLFQGAGILVRAHSTLETYPANSSFSVEMLRKIGLPNFAGCDLQHF